MTSAAYLARLDALVKQYDILTHPFYQAWSMGTVPLGQLRHYAKDYFFHELAFPTYVSAVHSRIDHAKDRQLLLENLNDEEQGPANHAELWLRFAEGLGVSRGQVNRHAPSAACERLIQAFKDATQHADPLIGLSCLYAYESQIPQVATAKISGLRKHYGIQARRTLEFFTVHESADVDHARDARRLLAKYAKGADEKAQTAALRATERMLKALWDELSAVYRVAA